MKIGNYDLYSIETSEFSLDGGAMFGIIPKTLWKEKLVPGKLNRVEMVTRSLLIVCEDRNVLIDTGNGSKWAKIYIDMYNINFSKYNILTSLKKCMKKNGFYFLSTTPFIRRLQLECKGNITVFKIE